MEYTARPPLYVPDYSNFHIGCSYCGNILSQVRGSIPLPCLICNASHYCGPACIVSHLHTGHKAQCAVNLDADIDIQGASITTGAQALWDLRKYTHRWHDELGDAAIAAMNLHADPTAMERMALVIRVSYVTRQPYPMRRFRLQSVTSEPMSTLTGTCMDAAIIRRQEHSIVNQRNGMVGCALIVLACDVPGVGLVFNSTFIGPEASILADPPPLDWQNRLWLSVRKNEIP